MTNLLTSPSLVCSETQTLEFSHPVLCCYVNRTSKMQIARISNISNWYFERVVFPGQKLLFESPLNAQLEIHTGTIASAILADRIPCDQLQIRNGAIAPASFR
ncbi:MAG: DUF1830 domain-containing protein [Leptolyngbyaceae cyanobacterium RU_5_1]|nr:DUF1830 domain-containing protein [Leptolyngbyaceae cyanobacterium RU_5_1]